MGTHHSLPLHSQAELFNHSIQPFDVHRHPLPAQTTKSSLKSRRRQQIGGEQRPPCLECARILQLCASLNQPLQRELRESKRLPGSTRSGVASSLPQWPLHAYVALRPPKAALLFHHFMDSMKPDADFRLLPVCPTVEAVAPLILRDRIAMHALLALSANNMKESFPDAETQSDLHYGIAIKILRDRMARFLDGEQVDLPAMLLAIILLCTFEIRKGDGYNASSHHLRAARHIIRTHMRDLQIHSDWDFLPFILDYYRHMWIATNVISANDGHYEICGNAHSLMLGLQSIDELRTRLGFNFKLSYPILTDFPRSARLANGREISIYEGTISFGEGKYETPTQEGCPSELKHHMSVATGTEALPPLVPAIKMMRQSAVLILLVVAHGSYPPDDALLRKIDVCVEEFLRELAMVKDRRLIDAMMMWAYILMGSCARRAEHRAALLSALQDTRYKRGFVEAVVELLKHMWSDKDGMAFGPFGIKRALALQDLKFMSLISSN